MYTPNMSGYCTKSLTKRILVFFLAQLAKRYWHSQSSRIFYVFLLYATMLTALCCNAAIANATAMVAAVTELMLYGKSW